MLKFYPIGFLFVLWTLKFLFFLLQGDQNGHFHLLGLKPDYLLDEYFVPLRLKSILLYVSALRKLKYLLLKHRTLD